MYLINKDNEYHKYISQLLGKMKNLRVNRSGELVKTSLKDAGNKSKGVNFIQQRGACRDYAAQNQQMCACYSSPYRRMNGRLKFCNKKLE